jgi:ABC-type multidrug transport system permease subunit
MQRDRTPFLLYTAGFLCLALNVRINGFEFLLPNLVGYFLICAASWSQRERGVLYLVVAIVAGLLIPFGFRDFFYFAYRESFPDFGWLKLLQLPLATLLALLVAGMIRRDARASRRPMLAAMAFATLPILAASYFANGQMPRSSNDEKLAAIFVQVIPDFYLALLTWLASRWLGNSRSID